MNAKPRYPTIKDVSAWLRELKPEILDDYRAEDETVPSLDVTLGWNPETGGWGIQTGDNSFTGVAYFYPIWAVGTLYRRDNTRDLARWLIDQLAEQWESMQ